MVRQLQDLSENSSPHFSNHTLSSWEKHDKTKTFSQFPNKFWMQKDAAIWYNWWRLNHSWYLFVESKTSVLTLIGLIFAANIKCRDRKANKNLLDSGWPSVNTNIVYRLTLLTRADCSYFKKLWCWIFLLSKMI